MQNDDSYYRGKVATEGRWINYIFFNVLTQIPGSLLSIFVLLSVGYFIFTATYKWAQNYYYELIESLFFIQIPSFYDLITWPATSNPAFLLLLYSCLEMSKQFSPDPLHLPEFFSLMDDQCRT